MTYNNRIKSVIKIIAQQDYIVHMCNAWLLKRWQMQETKKKIQNLKISQLLNNSIEK